MTERRGLVEDMGTPRRRRGAHDRRKRGGVGVWIGVGVVVVLVLAVGAFGARALFSHGGAASSSTAASPSAAATAGEAASGASATQAKVASRAATAGAAAASETAGRSSGSSAKTNWTPVASPAADQAVPVLMYHHILPVASNFIAITPSTFDAQMRYLHDNGYHPVSIVQLDEFVHTGKRLPDKPVLITFDDGRMNQITNGVPILKKYGFTATFFVVKKWVVTTSPSFMHAAELKQLMADGFDVQSHTTNHILIHPSKVSGGGMETYAHFKTRYWEPTNGMRTWMASTLGGPDVIALAYPGGRVNPQAEQLVEEAGYDLAFTTDSGYVTYQAGKNAEALPRWNTGARGTTLATFESIMRGAQRAAK